MLYVIAGCSLSGKTSSRQYLTKQYGISGIDTDTLRTITNHIAPDIDVGHTKLAMTNYNNMTPVIDAFFAARSFFDEPYIIEGDGINLSTMQSYIESGAAKVVVLGYPKTTVESMMARVENEFPTTHWIFQLTQEDAQKRVTELVQFSQFLLAEAKRYNLTFVDVSDLSLQEVTQRVDALLFASQPSL